MKGYTVFNVEQIDGLPEYYYAKPQVHPNTVQRIEHAEKFFAATGATVRHGGTMAYYSVTHDYVQMPPFESFREAESYYATLAHEATHSTRHHCNLFHRLAFRDLLGQGPYCARHAGIAYQTQHDRRRERRSQSRPSA